MITRKYGNTLELFSEYAPVLGPRRYRPILTATLNGKGVLDVDTVKGCQLGINRYPNGGCYGECYAYKTAHQYGIDFSTSVSRRPGTRTFAQVFKQVRGHRATWYRVGTAGDPSHDWENTLAVCERLAPAGKTPVIITKHWKALLDPQLDRLARLHAVLNTSVSGLDTSEEIEYRIGQLERLKRWGIRSVCRVVTCKYGNTPRGVEAKRKQDYLLSILPVIDNPLRATKSNGMVLAGDIILGRNDNSIGGGKYISLHQKNIHIGVCANCVDQCGVV
jgi:hypothetical protein